MISQIVWFDKLIALHIGPVAVPLFWLISFTIYLAVVLILSAAVYGFVVGKKDRLLRLQLIFFAVLFASIEIIKRVVGRIRPNGELYSFPSRHAAFAFFIAFSLPVRKPGQRTALIAWAILVAVSRVFLGVHYLSDVLFGAGIGIIAGVIFWSVGKKKSAKKLKTP